MKTIRRASVGDLTMLLVEMERAFIGAIFAADGAKKAKITGTSANVVWRRLHDEVGRASPKYFGFDGVRNRFLHFFKGGFASPHFIKEEREHKLEAKKRLDAEAPLEKALKEAGLGEAVLSAYRHTKLLSSFEKAKLQSTGKRPSSRAAASEISERLWAEYEAFRQRDLSERPIVYLFVDGAACNGQLGLRGAGLSAVPSLIEADRWLRSMAAGPPYGPVPLGWACGGRGGEPGGGIRSRSLLCRPRLPPGCISRQVHSST